jgi:hypothetical protein
LGRGRTGLFEKFVTKRLRPPLLAHPHEPCLLVLRDDVRTPKCIRLEEHEGARPLGIRGGIERRHRRAVVGSEENSARRANGVEYSPHVLHPRFKSGEVASEIGEPGPALVEQDEAV